jgi:hypothetical protein
LGSWILPELEKDLILPPKNRGQEGHEGKIKNKEIKHDGHEGKKGDIFDFL